MRELTPKRLARFREELEKAAVGPATVRKPRYQRAREPHIFLPAEVEEIRDKLTSLRDRTLVSLLAYSGPRPEEVVCRLAWEDIGERAIRYRDTKRHRVRFTPLLAPLAEDLREWFLATGRPEGRQPVIPAAGEPAKRPDLPGCRARGTRPRDLRSSLSPSRCTRVSR